LRRDEHTDVAQGPGGQALLQRLLALLCV
jgi:hypothetical protein